MNVGHERGVYVRELLFGANLLKQNHVDVRLMLTFVLRQSLVEATLEYYLSMSCFSEEQCEKIIRPVPDAG